MSELQTAFALSLEPELTYDNGFLFAVFLQMFKIPGRGVVTNLTWEAFKMWLLCVYMVPEVVLWVSLLGSKAEVCLDCGRFG